MTKTIQAHLEPEPGQIWRHFKGGTYKIIGVSTVVEQSAIDGAIANQLVPYCYAIDTEQPCLCAIGVFKMASGEFWCFLPTELGCTEMGIRMVIYHPVDCPHQIWARPLNHFLAPTEDGRSRFELVSVQSLNNDICEVLQEVVVQPLVEEVEKLTALIEERMGAIAANTISSINGG